MNFEHLKAHFFFFVPSLLVPLAEKGGEEKMANKPRQYYSVRRPVVHRSFNAESEGRPVPPSALEGALWRGILTEKY